MPNNKPVRNKFGELVGWPVPSATTTEAPATKVYAGQYFSLHPVNPDSQGQALFRAATIGPDADRIWTYMPYGPFGNPAALEQHMRECAKSRDTLFFTVIDNESTLPVGMVSFLNIATAVRTIEMGHIWYVPQAHRGKANTEISLLMMCEVFDQLGYRRVEWKCNALNLKSRAAAQRMGFSFEGVFRQHLVVKGQNRDTAWLALMDHEWPAVKANMEAWLYGDATGQSLADLNRPLLYATDPVLAAPPAG